MLDDQPPVPVGPGASVYIPRGDYHGTLNTGWQPLRFLVIYAPGGVEQTLRTLPDVTILPAGVIT